MVKELGIYDDGEDYEDYEDFIEKEFPNYNEARDKIKP